MALAADALPVKAALWHKSDRKAQIDMVLSEELTSAVKYDEEGVVEAVHTWLQPPRPGS